MYGLEQMVKSGNLSTPLATSSLIQTDMRKSILLLLCHTYGRCFLSSGGKYQAANQLSLILKEQLRSIRAARGGGHIVCRGESNSHEALTATWKWPLSALMCAGW